MIDRLYIEQNILSVLLTPILSLNITHCKTSACLLNSNLHDQNQLIAVVELCTFTLRATSLVFSLFQRIQTVSATDPDEPLGGHRFFFSLAQEAAGKANFSVRDNKGNKASVCGDHIHLNLHSHEAQHSVVELPTHPVMYCSCCDLLILCNFSFHST